MRECRVCGAAIEPFVSFGRMPIANGFLRPESFASEYFFDLAVGYCASCHMVQTTELVDPARLFHAQYAYFSSLSTGMGRHFEGFAADARCRYAPGSDAFVVEIGSNDGILLRHLAAAGVRHLGVEPSANVAEVARGRGVRTVCRFFDEAAARDIRAVHGPADAILGANVVTHVPDLHPLVRGVAALLTDGGVFVFEEPYLGAIVANTAYDQMYAEHVFYFSLLALETLFASHELEVTDVEPQPTHGGSMRYVVSRRGARPVRDAVAALRERETADGLAVPATYHALARRIEDSRDQLVGLLRELRAAGARVTGYGATAKGTTVTNYGRIGPDLVEFITDTTPGKQGTCNPGMHIPVVPPERFATPYPDYAVLFAWNHRGEIVAKEEPFRRAGGRFIEYVPTVRIQE